MSGEVETSQAEPDLTPLEGFLVGNQDLERLDALFDRFNIIEATGWYWDGHEDQRMRRSTGSSKNRARRRALP